MSEIKVYQDVEQLNNALDDAEKKTAISDNEFRLAVSKIYFDPRLEKLPRDSFSAEYRQAQLNLYERISGKKYDVSHETTPFNEEYELRQPYPYGTRSISTVGDTLIGYGHIIKNLPITADSRVLEIGSGYGSLSYHLAQMYVDVTCMDIDRRLLDFIAQRIKGFNHRVQLIHSDIHVYQPAQQFDIIIFHESFHHCHDHQGVLHKVVEMLSDSGTLIFAAEPIVPIPNIAMPYPWGLRMDGISLRCVRKFGWLELGFSVPYFYSLLGRFGLSYEEKRIDGCHFSHLITVKRKRKSLIQVIKGLMS